MDLTTPPARDSKAMVWTGRVISAVPVLVLIMSAVMKLMHPPELDEGFNHLGWPVNLALTLGIVELLSAIIYAIPQTAVLGAILVTGYLGGAIATHARIGEQEFVLPLVLGVLAWLGLFLRDSRVRAILPWRG